MPKPSAKRSSKALNRSENQKVQAIVGQTIRQLRKSTKVSQEDLGKLLSLHQTAVCRVEKGTQNLVPSQLNKVAEYFGVKVDAILMGKVNVAQVAERFGRKPSFPERYTVLQHSRMREILPLLQFIKTEHGESQRNRILTRLNMNGILVLGPDQNVSVNCNIDLARFSLSHDILTPKNFDQLIACTRGEQIHGFLHHMYETQTSPLHLLQSLLLNEHHYEANFANQIEDCKSNALTVSVKPQAHMKEVDYKDEVLGDFLCRFKKSYWSHFAEYIGAKPMELTEKECHFHGSEKCVYTITAA